MDKLDLKKKYRESYNPGARAKQPHLVEVPDLQYVMIDGRGDPGAEEYHLAIGALYSVAYAVKFGAKKMGTDFTVMPFEALWWSDPPEEFASKPKSEWFWTAMILQPDFVSGQMVNDALAVGVGKSKIASPTAEKVRLEMLEEGKAAQVLHIGAYADEAPTIERLHAYVQSQGMALTGKHHEVYMSDPRRVAPEKLRTIIRHPVRPR